MQFLYFSIRQEDALQGKTQAGVLEEMKPENALGGGDAICWLENAFAQKAMSAHRVASTQLQFNNMHTFVVK